MLPVLSWQPAAATTSTRVVSRSGMPANMLVGHGYACGTSTGNDTASHVTGPATPPGGTGSLALTTPAFSDEEIQWNPSSLTASDLTGLSFYEYGPSGSSVLVGAGFTDGNNIDSVVAYFAPNETWTQQDVMTASADWSTTSGGTYTDNGATTLATFIAGHPSETFLGLDIANQACSSGSTSTVNIDDLAIGLDSATTTYDFETPTTLRLGVALPAASVAGSAVTVRGTETTADNEGPLTGAKLDLYAQPAGSSTFTKVGSATASATGAVALVQHPTVTTLYEWRAAGGGDIGASTSRTATVKVATALTLHAATTQLAKGKAEQLTGTTIPAQSGLAITVWDKHGGKLSKLGTTKTSSGKWRFSHKLPKGKNVLYATCPATSRNAAGRSKSVTVQAS